MNKFFLKPRHYLSGILILVLILLILTLPLFTCVPLSVIESVFKILAIIAGTLFFTYKWITGWLIINLNIKCNTSRVVKDRSTDHLMINLSLVKGAIDSLWLDAIELRVCEVSTGPETENARSLKELCRLTPIGAYRRLFSEEIVAFQDTPDLNRPLNLSPGEEINFAAYTIVNKDAVISVEAFITGSRPFYNFKTKYPGPIQWVSSFVVLPNSPTVN